jgi:cytochrome c oxidase subunit 2
MNWESYLRRILFLPEQASSFAHDVDQLHFFVILTTLVMSSAVGLAALFFFVRFRRRGPRGGRSRYISGGGVAEGIIVAVPLAFFLLWFWIGFRIYVRMQTPPPDAMDVFVTAKQWMWKFSYPDGPDSQGTLHVPLGRPVRVLLTSRDVIHSFYVPAFRVKKDALPGRYTELWFEAIKEGIYPIECAEYCGANHSTMLGQVVVMPPERFDAWMAEERRGRAAQHPADASNAWPAQPDGIMAARGKEVAASVGCLKCHTTDGTPHIGPTWLDLYRRTEKLEGGGVAVADEPYLTESMMDPEAKVVLGFKPLMPSFKGKLTAPDAAALVEYIKTLRSERVTNLQSGGPVYEPIVPSR